MWNQHPMNKFNATRIDQVTYGLVLSNGKIINCVSREELREHMLKWPNAAPVKITQQKTCIIESIKLD